MPMYSAMVSGGWLPISRATSVDPMLESAHLVGAPADDQERRIGVSAAHQGHGLDQHLQALASVIIASVDDEPSALHAEPVAIDLHSGRIRLAQGGFDRRVHDF